MPKSQGRHGQRLCRRQAISSYCDFLFRRGPEKDRPLTLVVLGCIPDVLQPSAGNPEVRK
jgi:hypothetical protein